MSRGKNAIVAEQVSKCFTLWNKGKDEVDPKTKDLWALNNVSFELMPGQSMAIIGPNGSGKSTLLKILSGITKPTSGRIEINGRVASILDMGAGFHPELSGRENIFVNAQLLGFSKQEVKPKFDEIVAFSGIEQFIDEPVKYYSNGMFLRLAFSIVSNLDFDIYLLDEVLGVGDAEFHNKILSKFRDLKLNKSKSILIVSHNTADIINIAEEAIELRNGELIRKGNARILLMNYEDEFKTPIRTSGDIHKYFEYLSLSFLNDKEENETFINSEEIKIIIRGKKHFPETNCELVLLLKDTYDTILFTTSYIQEGISIIGTCEFVIETKIPAYFLNKGTFYFSIYGIDGKEIKFQYMNAGIIRVRYDQSVINNIPAIPQGPLFPNLNWKIISL
jgi:lipopolysaccharide transport system ATP-binding protein